VWRPDIRLCRQPTKSVPDPALHPWEKIGG
jgi:hypothetical protein